jgi:hypothetical protein
VDDRGRGHGQQLRACVHHPGWLIGKLEEAGLEADLALSDGPLSHALSTVVRQNAHLLAALHPEELLAATMLTPLPDLPTRADPSPHRATPAG